MRCPACGHENPEGAIFCNECAARIELACPQCNEVNPPESKFCNACGQALAAHSETPPPKAPSEKRPAPSPLPKALTEKILAQKGRIEGERRQVTVLFCDLEGSTALTEKLGDEKAFALIDEIFGILTQQIHRYEGTVQEFRGDGIMALFGAPIALENAAQRAVSAALAIHQEVTKFSHRIQEETRGPAIRMRIGIHTGPVVLGAIGSDLRLEFQVIGDTVNLAARMESLAEPGTSYVTEETFKLTEGLFRFEGLGDKQVKGKETPVTVYQVIAPSSRRTRFDVSAEQGLTPLVGRQRDLEFLINTFRRAQRGSGQAVVISSEAGMGKSRLLYEFRKVIANEPVFFFEGKCLSYSRSVAYHPVIDILKSFFQVNDGEADGAVRDKVVNVLNRLKISTNESLPYLLELLSVKESGIDPLTTSPEAMRERIKGALKSLVIKGAQAKPLILAFEDLHWIDASSREAIGDLLESIPAEPVFLVFTSRPQFTSDWGIKSYLHQIVLQSLSDGESVSMATYLMLADRIDNEMAQLVLEKTDGVPFFIEEFVRSLKDLNLIAGPGGGLRRDERGTLRIPSTIQDIIMARVDVLPETARYILKTGSVIEREFSHELIRRATGYENEELTTGLGALKEAELIYQRGIGSDITYIFKHALTMEVVHESILTSQKQQLHCHVGRAIESLYPDALEEHSATLARHFSEGGLYAEAAQYAKAAAKRAMRTGSYLDAIAHAQNRISVLEQLPEAPDNQKQIIDARTVLASYFMGLNRHLEAKEAVDPIVDLTVTLNYQKRLPGIYVSLGSYYFAVEKYDKAYQFLHQATDMAKKAGDWLNLWFGNFYLGHALCSECRYEEAFDCYNISLQLSEMGNHLSGISYLKGTISIFFLSFIGKIDTAYAMSEEAVQAAEKCGDSHTRGLAYVSHGSACFFKGDFERSRRFLTDAIDLCSKSGQMWWKVWAESWLAHTYFFTQRYKEAIEFYTRTISTINETLIHHWMPYQKISLERAIQADCGTISPGFDPATCRRENKFKVNEGIIESTIADILIKIDPKFIPEAEASVRAAIAADERNHTKWYLGQDYAVYSEVCRVKGDVPMARAQLMRAIEIFRECGADGWVEKYEKELFALQ